MCWFVLRGIEPAVFDDGEALNTQTDCRSIRFVLFCDAMALLERCWSWLQAI
jgi:hypothetical protein